MKKNQSKLIALFISLIMICALFPLQIFAVNDQEASILTSEVRDGDRVSFHYTIKNGDVPGAPF